MVVKIIPKNNNTHNWYRKGAKNILFCFKWYVAKEQRLLYNNTQGWNAFNVFNI